jgi:hypothetical protein
VATAMPKMIDDITDEVRDFWKWLQRAFGAILGRTARNAGPASSLLFTALVSSVGVLFTCELLLK